MWHAADSRDARDSVGDVATSRTSAGLLPFRTTASGELEVLIGHMGGPFWAKKDDAAWSIFKGEYEPEAEEPEAVARREFEEETGQPAPEGHWLDLGEVKQSGGKRVRAWAVESPGLDPSGFVSNTFTVEWPPRSGRQQEFPEIDRAEWVTIEVAAVKLVKAQRGFAELLQQARDAID